MMLVLFILGILSELSLFYVTRIWKYHQWAVAIAVLLLGFWTGAAMVSQFNLLVVLMVIISFYRFLNLLRVGKDRIDEKYLRRAARRTSLLLIGAQIILLIASSYHIDFGNQSFLVLLVSTQFVISLLVFGVTSHNLFKTKHHPTNKHYSDKYLPTVTVAIPARNETADLGACLRTILANDYPKLEILVLDDCSQDRTAEIIRDFAHDGVRFIEGKPVHKNWLAKNHAYDQLVQAASGEVVLFCGVDVRFGPGTIRNLVSTMLTKKRSMLSVMPFRIGGGVRTAFIQPMRYWWEIALPRRMFNRPPVLSSCWLIKKKALLSLGGFKAVSRKIIPESYFARELIKKDLYAFLSANEHLDVRTVKNVEAQLLTAVRTRYPQLRHRPENVLLLSFIEAVFLLGPFILAAIGFVQGFSLVPWLGIISSAFLAATHYTILAATNPANSLIAIFNFPFVVLTEIFVLHLSMIRYEFSKVEWKGRNICIPVMQAVNSLPKA